MDRLPITLMIRRKLDRHGDEIDAAGKPIVFMAVRVLIWPLARC